MADPEKLINLELQIHHQHQTEDLIFLKGFKLNLYKTLYSIQQLYGSNKFLDVLFIIFEFIQLMAFPIDLFFDENSDNNDFTKAITNFFRYFQLIFLWKDSFFIISYIITCLYILIFFILFLYVVIKHKSPRWIYIIKIIVLIIQIQNVLNIPFLRTLFSVFSCENDVLKMTSKIKCKGSFHILLISLSIAIIIILKSMVILFHTILFEFGNHPNKLKSGYSSSADILLDLTKLILSLFYQFISHKMTLSIITLLLGIIILIHFLVKEPYSNAFTNKLYLSLYSIFAWSCLICIISILLKNSKFKGGIVPLICGYIFILIMIYLKEYSLDKLVSFFYRKNQDENHNLLRIEYFINLLESFSDKINVQEIKLLFSYILNYESKCTEKDCFLKKFLKMPIKPENLESLKILLLQHAEILYKDAITEEPNNIKLRISYILFLFNKLKKKLKCKNELSMLNKFENNFETSFLIYKTYKYINDNINDSNNNTKESNDNNINITQAMNYKLLSDEIKTLIEDIVKHYSDFWFIILNPDSILIENFHKISKLGEDIKSLNKELNEKIKLLEDWDLLDQDLIKLYFQYLKEIINNDEKAKIYKNKIIEEEEIREHSREIDEDEININELNKNDEYSYIIISLSESDFNNIYNLSLSTCKLLGYRKEELIGHSSDILFPLIYNSYRKKFIRKKLEEYKKNLLLKLTKSIQTSWVEDCFFLHKIKYLIQSRIKWSLISNDDKIYIIGNILIDNEKYINQKEGEIIYILTNNNLIIQNFSSNASMTLNFKTYIVDNNCDIFNYINELKEKMVLENGNKNRNNKDEKDINKGKNINRKSKKKYDKINILKKYNYLGNNSINVITWNNIDKDIKESNDDIIKNTEYSSPIFEQIRVHKKRMSINSGGALSKHFLEKKSDKKLEKKRLSNPKNKRQSKDHNKFIRGITMMIQKNLDNKKNNNKNENNINKNFTLKIKEAKFNEHKVGYIFILRPYIAKAKSETNKNPSDVNNNKENKNINLANLSNKSLVSFGAEKNNKNNNFKLSSNNSDFNFQNINFDDIEEEFQFTFDIKEASFRQFKYIDEDYNFYEKTKQLAIKKLEDAKKSNQNEESEEEEETSEYEEYSDEDNSKNSNELISDEKKDSTPIIKEEQKINEELKNKIQFNHELIKNEIKSAKARISRKSINPLTQTLLNSIAQVSKHIEQEKYYHVDMSKISLYVYNYSTGFAEIQKYNKISHLSYLINKEKESVKNFNSLYKFNAKFLKGKKKGIINKKEENEINPLSATSLRIKEIYRALESKEKESVIIKIILYSILILVLIVGAFIMNILVYFDIKNSVYNFFILIQKSDDLYKNLLFEITVVREMLIVNNSYYTNIIKSNKTFYYQTLSKMLYNFYLDNAFIISNITNHFNVLTKEEEESISNNPVEIYIIDPMSSTELNYQYKTYNILIYSAYRELNAAIYHISSKKMEEIYQYSDDVYYFLKNGMSNLLIISEEQMWTLSEKFEHKIESGHKTIIICCIVLFIIYCLCTFIFVYYYRKVSLKKYRYLSLINNFDNNLVFSTLQKCESFSKKLHDMKNKELNQDNKLNDSSMEDSSELDNYNSVFNLDRKIKGGKMNKDISENKVKNKNIYRNYFLQILLFLAMYLWQLSIYIFYYDKMTMYKHIISYEYWVSMYASNFLFIFIGIREYIFDKKFKFYNQSVDEYVTFTLDNFYYIYSDSAELKDENRIYFPDSYQNFLNYLYNGKICEFINIYNLDNQLNPPIECNKFFYGSGSVGFFPLLTTFVEEIRTLKSEIDRYYDIAKEKNFVYNESYLNDPNGYYEKIYNIYENNIEEYKLYNPANILSRKEHKQLLITYLYINTQVYSYLISESLKEFERIFSKYNTINLSVHIVIITAFILAFFILWIPFLYNQNKIFLKIKNMLSIIPSELLINLPNINDLLGIEESII